MDINYFDLSGGINQATTKTEMGVNTKILYWMDSENVEIYNNKGIIKQKGNTLLFELPEPEAVTGMREMESDGKYKLIITTISGKIYVYSHSSGILKLLDKKLTGKQVNFTNFLYGVLVSTESDGMFYIKDNQNFDVVECNLNDLSGNALYPDCIAVFKGRVWCAKESTIYYSALGSYSDFTTENDAGYINDFHTDTADIICMKNYKDYLAVYKKERVYLLSGSNPADFAIIPFADRGAVAKNSVVNVDNKQYFLSSNGIFALEQVGELNQIRLGSEISQNIQNEFKLFNTAILNNSTALHYQKKSQMWYLFPYLGDSYYHTIWINDYVNHAWYKRVIPQDITAAANFNSYIVSADKNGKIYYEDYGTNFDGQSIKFMWKSPFLSLGNVHHRKIIDEFYFVLDDLNDNKFKFSIYKDYDSEYSEDKECIYSYRYEHMLWADNNCPDDNPQYCWATETNNIPVWSIGTDVLEKAEIYGSFLSVQLCVEGDEMSDSCAILGLEFREIYNDE